MLHQQLGSRHIVQGSTLPGKQYLSADFNAVLLTPPVHPGFHQHNIRTNSWYHDIKRYSLTELLRQSTVTPVHTSRAQSLVRGLLRSN